MATYVLGTSGEQFNHRRDFYPSPQKVAELYPSSTPFLSRLYQMGPIDISGLPDPTFSMFEYEAGWRYQHFSVNGTPSAWSNSGNPAHVSGTTVTIDVDGITGLPSTVDSSWIGTVVRIYDSTEATLKGIARIHAVSDTDTLTLKGIGNPSVAAQTMTALANDDILYVVAGAFGEKSESPDANADELTSVRNSCQIDRLSYQVSKIAMLANMRGDSSELLRQRGIKGNEFKLRLSKMVLFGYRLGGIGGTAYGAGSNADATTGDTHTTDADSDTVRTTMGYFSAMERYGISDDTDTQQNVFNRVRASYTYDDFVDDSIKMFQYSMDGGVKVAYCGPEAISFWSKVGADGLKTSGGKRETVSLSDPQKTSLGFQFRELVTPNGVLQLVRDDVLRGTPHKNAMYIIDEGNIGLVQYEPMRLAQNIKTDNAPNYQKDEYYANIGLKLCLVKSHALFNLL